MQVPQLHSGHRSRCLEQSHKTISPSSAFLSPPSPPRNTGNARSTIAMETIAPSETLLGFGGLWCETVNKKTVRILQVWPKEVKRPLNLPLTWGCHLTCLYLYPERNSSTYRSKRLLYPWQIIDGDLRGKSCLSFGAIVIKWWLTFPCWFFHFFFDPLVYLFLQPVFFDHHCKPDVY